ncbi:MAG: HepT-like ribonuclease domain-containing protein [Candidatus Bathyarchaeia archaeon]
MEIKVILSEALECIKRARSIEPKSELEASALRWEIYATLQNVLDAISMIVAELGLKKPSSYSELGFILYENDFINESIAKTVREIAAVRNILAHAYRKILINDLMDIANKLLLDVEKVVDSLTRIVEDKSIDPKPCIYGLTNAQLSSLKKALKRREVLIAYLFGSRARGVFREDSDYDIAVLFKSENVSILDEAELTVEIADTLGISVEKVNIVSLNKAELPLKARVLREGKIIYQYDEAFRKSWERKEYLKLLRNMDFYAIYFKRALKHTKRI